jgi:2-iminoacetate synthase ThiH
MTTIAGLPTVADVLEKALGGDRITDDDAVVLLRSRDLVAVGRTANAIRNRKNDPRGSRSSSTGT